MGHKLRERERERERERKIKIIAIFPKNIILVLVILHSIKDLIHAYVHV